MSPLALKARRRRKQALSSVTQAKAKETPGLFKRRPLDYDEVVAAEVAAMKLNPVFMSCRSVKPIEQRYS